MRAISNIFWLGTKEIRSFLRDWVLVGLTIWAFSVVIVAQAQSNSQELHNASIAYVDEDHSELSRRIIRAFLPPYFQTPPRDSAASNSSRPVPPVLRAPGTSLLEPAPSPSRTSMLPIMLPIMLSIEFVS